MERICLEDGALCRRDEPYEARPLHLPTILIFVVGQRITAPPNSNSQEIGLTAKSDDPAEARVNSYGDELRIDPPKFGTTASGRGRALRPDRSYACRDRAI
jgi:hypothetical protein